MPKGDKKPVVMGEGIVNDLTTGGASAALSAEMGKVLGNRTDKHDAAINGDKYTVDSAMAYTKDVPTDVLDYAEVTKVGGMTYKYGETLRSAPVTKVESVGVNLIPFPYADATKTVNGVTFTVNGDGTLGVKGTVTGNSANFYLFNNLEFPSGAYIASCDNGYMAFYKNGSWYGEVFGGKTVKIVVAENDKLSARIVVENGDAADYTICPVLNRGTTALPYEPYKYSTLPIPEAVRNLDGYGWGINETVYNYIDFEKKQFVKRVGVVDMGTLVWLMKQDGLFYSWGLQDLMSKAIICEKYAVGTVDEVYLNPRKDKAICVGSGNFVGVADSTYTDATTFKSAMSGVMLYYELAESIITDISDILPSDNILGVDVGGTVTMVNEYGYDVPSEIVYQNNVLNNRASAFEVDKVRCAVESLMMTFVNKGVITAADYEEITGEAYTAE